MKVFLMHRDRDFGGGRALPANEEALTQDLELTTLFAAMAAGDDFLAEQAKRGVLLSLTEPEAILYRQQVLADCLEHRREGSEIARQVVRALLEKQIKVFFVTHMFDLAHGFWAEGLATALFLRAERQSDGSRTYRLVEREPLPTSYGEDSYRRIFRQAPTTSGTYGGESR